MLSTMLNGLRVSGRVVSTAAQNQAPTNKHLERVRSQHLTHQEAPSEEFSRMTDKPGNKFKGGDSLSLSGKKA